MHAQDSVMDLVSATVVLAPSAASLALGTPKKTLQISAPLTRKLVDQTDRGLWGRPAIKGKGGPGDPEKKSLRSGVLRAPLPPTARSSPHGRRAGWQGIPRAGLRE